MNKKFPLLTIGMPVYNGEKHLRQAVDSLLSQDYRNFDLLILDNSSEDGTKKICLHYARNDRRIRYYRNKKNLGPTYNFNRAFSLSSGKYFMWACHDDYWKQSYVRSCLNGFKQSKNIILVGSECQLIDSETEKLVFIDKGLSTLMIGPAQRFKRYKETIHSGTHIGGIFYGIYLRRTLQKAMPIKRVIAADQLLLAELALTGNFFTVSQPLMVKRYGGVSGSYAKTAQVIGVKNRFLISNPLMVRELLLQKIIFQSKKLKLPEKIRLACWSLGHYLKQTKLLYLGMRFNKFINQNLIKNKVFSALR
ncbi:hypothetical protein A2160_02680 [Candidatus Beckwithbacteria bacterium RBG_13_42_9]|uniref:Glycosyltransferase 2-like domain-containing protein n=1 Tax=Candidatus Beckwithbacteria bacterium RBG_13_42_9 TaxID=1797457 RepID=A0A1F5E7M3_9BACT|nr:MAG: hypothetical protein A2160_02680 [Candidatus Beckwithbacteria bacterium RBG_13_42_9]